MQEIKLKPVDVANKWYYLDIPIFHGLVLAYVETRDDMALTVGEATSRFHIPTATRINNFVLNWVGQNGSYSDINGDAFGFAGHGFVRVDKMATDDLEDILVLDHECLHVANALLRGIDICEGANIECLCYTHEYIFGELLKQMLNQQGLYPTKA